MWEWLTKFVTWIGQLIAGAFSAITQFLVNLFGGLWDLVTGFGYMLTQAADVVLLALTVLLYLVQVVFAFGAGLMRSIARLATFDPATITSMHNPYQKGTSLLLDVWSRLGGDVIAQIAGWVWWILLAMAVLWLFAGAGTGQTTE